MCAQRTIVYGAIVVRSDSRIEQHPKRNEIVKRLVSGEKIKTISEDYGIHRNSLSRAKKQLLQGAVARLPAETARIIPGANLEIPTGEAVTAEALVGDLQEIKAKLKNIYDVSYAEGKLSNAIQALDRQIKTVDSLIRMAELAEAHQSKTIKRHPEYQRIIAAMAEVFRRFPGAKDVFTEIMDKLGSEESHGVAE